MMIFARIFLSLIFIPACLFQGCFANIICQPLDDFEVGIKMYQSADKSEQWNAIFFVDTNYYDSIISELSTHFNKILFFQVDKTHCPNTGLDFGIRTWPSVVFRRFGNNEVTLVSPNLTDLEGGELVNKLYEYENYDEGIEEITVYDEFRSKLTLADKDDLLITIYIVDKDDFKEIEPFIATVAQLYKSSVKVFKINSPKCSSADPIWNSVQTASGTCVTIFYRKFGMIVHRLYGFDWPMFYELLLKYQDFNMTDDFHEGLAGETIIAEENRRTTISNDIVQYAEDDEDFSSMLKAAEQANRLIILYIVDNDKYNGVDKSVEVLAQVFPTISVIKVNTAMCKGVANRYADEGNAEIVSFPTFIVRKFQENLAKFVGFNTEKLHHEILSNKDSDKIFVEVVEEHEPTSPRGIHSLPSEYGQEAEENEVCETNPHFVRVCSNIKKLPILINGSTETFTSLDPSESGTYQLVNTCAFDSFASIIMVAYSDSVKYREKVDSSDNDYFDFISKIVNNGITRETYTERAQLIISKTNPIIRKHIGNRFAVECDTTIYNIVGSLFEDFPTKSDTKISVSDNGSTVYTPLKPNIYITYQTPNGRIENLQEFLNKCFERETLKNSVIDKKISNMHIFIDVFTWNEDYSLSKTQNSDITDQVKMGLRDIPQHLVYDSTSYVLRGVINYKLGATKLITSSGHYTAYAHREDGTWQLFDDLSLGAVSVDKETKATIDLLVYTI